MPEYVYKAVTKQGQIVKNRVEEASKNNLVKKLKHNDLLPIEVVQVGLKSRNGRMNKRNVIDIDDVMKTANSANILQGRTSAKLSARDEKLIIQALVEKRNNQLKQNRPTEPINELLIKLIEN